jgi:hypothetical protein
MKSYQCGGWFVRLGMPVFAMMAFITSGTTLVQAATFPNISFECPVGGRVLFARRTTTQPISAPIIQFTSLGKFTATQRCQEVAARFTYLNNNPGKNTLAFLTTGMKRGMPIVCSVQNYGDACEKGGSVQLLTLHPRDKSPERRDQALSQLVVKLHHAASQTPVLLDNQPRLYINMQELLENSFQEVEESKK